VAAMTYEEYIASPQWRKLRALAIERDGSMCRGCPNIGGLPLEVHHARYPPRGEWHLDRVENLTTFCVECHDLHTSHQRAKRYSAVVHAVPDTVRVIPATEVVRAQLQIVDVQDHRSVAVVNAQWPDRRSIEPPLTEHRRNYQQAEED
jgi:hypothetical protein